MTAIAALTIADGQATPVSHTFSPVSIDNTGVAKWADRSGGFPAGYPTITMQVREPRGNSSKYRVSGKVTVPIVETVDGVQTVTNSFVMNFDSSIPASSTQSARDDAYAYLKNFLSTQTVSDAMTDLEAVY
jgi:hypothetical protein